MIDLLRTYGFDILLALTLLLGMVLYLSARTSWRSKVLVRVRDVAAAAGVPQGQRSVSGVGTTVGRRALLQLAGFGDQISLFDATQRLALSRKLVRAGYRGGWAVSILIGLKVICGGLMGIVAIVFGPRLLPEPGALRVTLMLGAFLVGMMLPEMVLDKIVQRRLAKIASALPDALDLLVICSNAGYSLPASMARVSQEIRSVAPPLGDELTLTAHEMQINTDPTAALHNLVRRIDIPAMRSLVATLIQTQHYGTPITQALRQLARSERAAHLLALEEKAAKLSTKITLPMMLFILPTVLVIAGGPAVMRLMEAFSR